MTRNFRLYYPFHEAVLSLPTKPWLHVLLTKRKTFKRWFLARSRDWSSGDGEFRKLKTFAPSSLPLSVRGQHFTIKLEFFAPRWLISEAKARGKKELTLWLFDARGKNFISIMAHAKNLIKNSQKKLLESLLLKRRWLVSLKKKSQIRGTRPQKERHRERIITIINKLISERLSESEILNAE